MVAGRTPGSLGLYGNPKPDSGTLVRTRTETPGVDLSYTWDPRKKEGVTKSIAIKRADAYKISDGLVVGNVYFAVDIDKIDLDDMLGLAPLVNSLMNRVKEGFEISLLCVGAADYRASDHYNYDLGNRRADNVAQFIKKFVLGSPNTFNPVFTVKTPFSLGESRAAQPTKYGRLPSEWTMGKDRVVTIAIDKEGLIPPVTLAFEGPVDYSKWLEVMEITAKGKVLKDISRVVTRKDEEKDNRKERSDQRRHARGKQNMAEDPFRALVNIIVTYVENTVAGKKIGELHYKAVYVPTGRVLFSLPKPALKNSNGEFDYKTIYEQLKSGQRNITARINVQLGRKIAK